MGTPPREILLHDSINRQTEAVKLLTKWLEETYLQTQLKESQKRPRKVNIYTVNVNAVSTGASGAAKATFQTLPRNDERYDFAVVNSGPGDLLFNTENFDPVSIFQQFSDPNAPDTVLPVPNQVVT